MKSVLLSLALLLVIGMLQPNSFIPALRAQRPAGLLFVTVADVTATQEVDRLVNALTKAGYNCLPMPDTSGNGVIHVQVGPYTSQAEADAARSRLIAAGYKLPDPLPDAASSGFTQQQRDLEAQALAKLSGDPRKAALPPSSGNDLEAQALAHLNGGAPAALAATGGDLEAQALQALQSNTQRAEVERQHQEELAAARAQQQAQEAQAAAEQAASAPQPQQSNAATFLNGLSAVLGQVNNQLAAQNAQTSANIAAQQAQLAQIQQAQQQQAKQALQRSQQQVPPQQTAASSTAVEQVSDGTRRCPNGGYVDAAANCDCRSHSANAMAYCPSGNSTRVAAQTSVSTSRNGASAPITTASSASTPLVAGTHTNASTGSTFSYSPPQSNTGGQFGPSTGTAAPPALVCPDVTKPCLTQEQYKQYLAQQAAKKTASTSGIAGCLYNPNMPPPTTGPCAANAPTAPQNRSAPRPDASPATPPQALGGFIQAMGNIEHGTPGTNGTGSIAVNPATRAHYITFDMPNQAKADSEALRLCGSNCTIELQFSNKCAAFSIDNLRGGTAWAVGSGGGPDAAKQAAINGCMSNGGGACYAVSFGCDGIQYWQR